MFPERAAGGGAATRHQSCSSCQHVLLLSASGRGGAPGGGSRTSLTSGILYDGNTLSITVGVPFNPLAVLMKRVLDRKV